MPPPRVKELLDHLESDSFDATVNIASGLGLAKAIVQRSSVCQELASLIAAEAPGVADTVSARFWTWASQQIDQRYAHPRDAAMFAVLLILHDLDKGRWSRAVAEGSEAPNTCWVARILQRWEDDQRLGITAVPAFLGPAGSGRSSGS